MQYLWETVGFKDVFEDTYEVCSLRYKGTRQMWFQVDLNNNNQCEEMYLQPKDLKRFNCEQCTSSYTHKKALDAHIRNKHTEDKPLQICDLCPLKFKEKKSLVAHKKKKHENPNEEFSCSVCGKRYSQRKTLNRHLLSHDKQWERNQSILLFRWQRVCPCYVQILWK